MVMSENHIKDEIFQRRAYYIAEGLPWPIIQRKLKVDFTGHHDILKEVWSETAKAAAKTRAHNRSIQEGTPLSTQSLAPPSPTIVPESVVHTVVTKSTRYIQLEFDFKR